MKITTSKTVPVTAEIVAQASELTNSVMIKVGPIKVKSLRVHKDKQGWFVMRGARGHDKHRLVSAHIMAIDHGDPVIVFNT